jgi:hypothetical protein
LKTTALGGMLAMSGESLFAQAPAGPAKAADASAVYSAWELNPAEYIEYGRSFICNEYTAATAPAADPNNKPMFLIESRTQITHNGKSTTYYQCASCKSENTYPENEFFKSPNYDFTPIFGPDNTLIFRRPSKFNWPSKEYKRVEGVKWGKPIAALRKPRGVRVLENAKDVFEVTRPDVALPIIARTHLRTDDGYEAIIEYPVKTMNATIDNGDKYQIDTGPIAWPNLWTGPDRGTIGCLSLAYIAFNGYSGPPTFVEIVEEQQIEVAFENDPSRKALVYHYEQTPGNYRFTAKSTMVALE